MMFAVGAFVGAGLAWASVAWWVTHGEFIIVDRWWLENAERWEWRRQDELSHLAASATEPSRAPDQQ